MSEMNTWRQGHRVRECGQPVFFEQRKPQSPRAAVFAAGVRHDNPTFPNDSTADQWLDDGQYAAYTSLGRELGRAAYEEMQMLAGSNVPIHAPAKNPPDDTGAQRRGSIRARDRSGARRLCLRHKQPTAGS